MKESYRNIINFYGNHTKSETVAKFAGVPYSRSSIYAILERYENNGNLNRKVGSGRKATKASPGIKKRLLETATGKVGQSVRKLGRKFHLSKSYVHDILRNNSVIYRKRKEAPKTSEKQKVIQKERLELLMKFVCEKSKTDFVLDDESYFTLTGSQNPGYYVDRDKVEDVPDEIRLTFREKFCPKVLVWAAVSCRGMSTLCIRKTKAEAVNAEIYVKECLRKHLLPFLKEKYPSGHFVFWQDLASCHYAKFTQNWLSEEKVPVISKKINPPNAPQIRPIERFWAHLKAKVYADGWTAQSEDQLCRRIKEKAKTFNDLYFSKLFEHFKERIIRAHLKGLNNLI